MRNVSDAETGANNGGQNAVERRLRSLPFLCSYHINNLNIIEVLDGCFSLFSLKVKRFVSF